MEADAPLPAPTPIGLGSLPGDLKKVVISHLSLTDTKTLLQVPGWREHALGVLLATCKDLEPYTDLLFPACRRRGDAMDRTVDTSAGTVATARSYGGFARRLEFIEYRTDSETAWAIYYLLQRCRELLPFFRPREWFPSLVEAKLSISSHYGTAAFVVLPHHLTTLNVAFGNHLSLTGLATIEQFTQLQELVVKTAIREPLTLAPFLKMARTLRVLRIGHVYPVVFDRAALEKLLRRFRALRVLEITPRSTRCLDVGDEVVYAANPLDCLAAMHDARHAALEEFAAYLNLENVPQPVDASSTANVVLLDLGADVNTRAAGYADTVRFARSLFPEAHLIGGDSVSALP